MSYAWFQVILHEVFHLLLFMFGWFHLSVPGKQDLQSGHCVQVACLELCLWLPVCRVPIQSVMHTCRLLACTCCAGIWILLLEAAPITVALAAAGTNMWKHAKGSPNTRNTCSCCVPSIQFLTLFYVRYDNPSSVFNVWRRHEPLIDRWI